MRTLAAVFLCCSCLSISGQSVGNEAKSRLEANFRSDLRYLQELYLDLHRNPELSFLEEETAKRVAHELKSAGFEIAEKVGFHGVVGVLRNGNGPVVLLRTDMDALPIKEQTGLLHASTKKQVNTTGEEVPVMHACGHDLHMSAAIGTARFLARNKDLFSGTVVVIGQSAEERGSGARAMLKAVSSSASLSRITAWRCTCIPASKWERWVMFQAT